MFASIPVVILSEKLGKDDNQVKRRLSLLIPHILAI